MVPKQIITNFLVSCLPVLRSFARPVRRGYHALRASLLGRVPQWRLIGSKFHMYIDPNDWMDRAFYFGSYEQHLVNLVAATVRTGDVCIDVGAGGRGIAVKPDPGAMDVLRSNVRRNGFQNVRLYSCALGDCDGFCTFTLSHQLGWSSRFPNDLAKTAVATTISVPTRRLDDIDRKSTRLN